MNVRRALTLAAGVGFLTLLLGGSSYASAAPRLIQRTEGYVWTGDVMIYVQTIGSGPPLMLLHGGPGSTHEDFLPYLLPLAVKHKLVLIDERGSGRSQQLNDLRGYNLDAMVADVDAVRKALGLGKIDLLGHSFGGILAQAYAIKHPESVRRLILAGTGSSARRINADFAAIKNSLPPQERARLDALEAKGAFDRYGAETKEYRELADEIEFPYSYRRHPPPWDAQGQPLGWDVLGEIWGRKSDFHIDGNLAGFDFVPALKKLRIPTLIIYGDHDLLTDATAEETHHAIANSKIVRLSDAGHMTYVDRNREFLEAVSSFLAN